MCFYKVRWMVSENKQNRRYKQINFIGLQNSSHPSQHTVGNVCKLLETVSKGLCRNRSRNRCHTFLDCRYVCETWAFHDALQAGKQKSAGARSGEHGGWSRTATPCWAKNWWTRIAQGAGTLSCSNIHCPVLCNSGRTRWMCRSNRFKTSS